MVDANLLLWQILPFCIPYGFGHFSHLPEVALVSTRQLYLTNDRPRIFSVDTSLIGLLKCNPSGSFQKNLAVARRTERQDLYEISSRCMYILGKIPLP